MATTTWAALRDLLADRYDELRARLARRLGSEELASESLNEAWLRLHRQDDAGAMQSPIGYVLRMAVNIATDHRRAESRRARRSEVRAALEIPDTAPDPAREVEGRLQLEALQQAIETLPERSREILIAARLHGLPQQDIADRFGITTRMVRMELRRALDHCEACLEKKKANYFLSGSSQSSKDETQCLPPVPPRSKRDDTA
ncbi:RNA polymerase sigma factor [Bradyrhizobium sp. USDA 10063]